MCFSRFSCLLHSALLQLMNTGKTTLLKQGRTFRFVEQEIVRPDGRISTIDKVEHPGAVVILPVDRDERLIILKQFRPALLQTIYEFPAGTLEDGEDPENCARRELAEEIGKAAAQWVNLGVLYPAPGFCDEVQYCYFASGLSDAHAEMDADEVIEPERMTVAEIEAAITRGEIRDGKSLAIFLRARLAGLI
jgi:ADP-ribose pyrophosphatase